MRKIEKTIVAADVQNTASFACFTRCVGCGGPRDTDVSIGATRSPAPGRSRPMTGVPAARHLGSRPPPRSGTVIWKVPPAATPAGIIR